MSSFSNFRTTLVRLVEGFERLYPQIHSQHFDEANLRLAYLDPFFEALGWDVRNTAQVSLHAREVVVEPPSTIGGRRKRPDYVFRIGGIDKLLCEAKRPRLRIEDHYYQIQNYVYNARLWVGLLSDFEHLMIFVVGAQPSKKLPFSPALRLHYTQFNDSAQRIWDLLSKDAVAKGSLDQLAQNTPKVTRRGKQGWLIPPDRNKTVDNVFLGFLEDERAKLARALHADNRTDWTRYDLTEATQLIIDRILFQRICEDRDIDVGKSLSSILEDWDTRGAKKHQLWPSLTANFHHLGKTFNGGIFGKTGKADHFIDTLTVSDSWLADFIDVLSAEDGQYLFNVIPVEILGSVYERFLGSIVLPSGKIEPKPEVRKAGGVYYTPRFVVNHIVERAVDPLLHGKSPADMRKIKILDPACGSGSFLIRAFESICHHHLDWFAKHPDRQKKEECYRDRHGYLRLTTGYKRQLVRNSIFGVDIDRQAVEVTQMSLYLRILEDESRETLESDRRLFPRETYLPDLSDNIKCGNSLIDTDCVADLEGDREKLHQLNPFNWEREFEQIMKRGRFDAVIGNPPYFNVDDTWGKGDYRLGYLKSAYDAVYNDKTDVLFYFLKRAVDLSKDRVCFIVSRAFLEAYKADKLRSWLATNTDIAEIIDFQNYPVFPGVGISTAIISLRKPKAKASAHVWQLTSDEGDLANLSERLSNDSLFHSYAVKQSRFAAPPWIFAHADASRLLEKVDRAGDPIKDFLDIGKGMETGRNDVFGKLDPDTIASWRVPKGMSFIRARNSDIDAYHITDASERILYLENCARFKDLPPKVQEHLRDNTKVLKARAAYVRGDCDWWKFTWPLHKELYARRRIYSPYLATYNRFALDADRKFLGLTDTTVIFDGKQPEDILYVLGCLNSKLLTYRFRFIGKLKGNGIYEYFWNSISKLSIRRIDFKNKDDATLHDRIRDGVTRMMALKDDVEKAGDTRAGDTLRRAIEATEAEINEAVYTLYGIEPAERDIVQTALRSI